MFLLVFTKNIREFTIDDALHDDAERGIRTSATRHLNPVQLILNPARFALIRPD